MFFFSWPSSHNEGIMRHGCTIANQRENKGQIRSIRPFLRATFPESCRACPSGAFTSKVRHYNVSISFREKGTDLFSRSCLKIRAIPVAKSAIMNHNRRILSHLNAIVCIACRERMAQLARLRRITLR